MRDQLIFRHTEQQTRDMVKRYMKCFDNKLELLSHQVADFCEKISGDSTLGVIFYDDKNSYSLHNCIDRFLMNVLKNFLQSIDEGFADIIDELEDACADESNLSSRLKKLIFEFQQISFDKRERLSADYFETKEEKSKVSFAWFDNFFGDVTSLLKNPINPNSYVLNQDALLSGSPMSSKRVFEPRVTGVWVKKEGGVINDNSPEPKTRGDFQNYDRADSTSEIGFEPRDLGKSIERVSNGTSENITWKLGFSQEDALSSTKSATTSQIRPKMKSINLKSENLKFEDIFTVEQFTIDNSGVFSIFAESPNCLLLGTDRKKLYRFMTNSNQKEVLFDSKLLILTKMDNLFTILKRILKDVLQLQIQITYIF